MLYSLDLLNPPFPHRASYDNEGNVILPPLGFPFVSNDRDEFEAPRVEAQAVEWVIIEDDGEALQKLHIAAQESSLQQRREPLRAQLRQHVVAVRQFAREAVQEGTQQYRVSIEAGKPLLARATEDLIAFSRAVWHFLTQPVWVPTRKREIREYSRGTLFLLDIVRFGGTFTVIFLALFVALNAESFWQIGASKIQMILSSPSIATPGNDEDAALLETLKASAGQSQSGRERGELLSMLPPVGPPDNRILIPKLKLNVPLVTPPVDSLLRQDWAKVEEDIQTTLTDGVVHYPGTARPGQAGNFFVTGHSSYYPWAPGKYKTVFARLPELQPGDEYWVYYKGDRHRYVIREKREVNPSDVTVLDQPEHKRMATLMTCTPVGTTLRRLILVAQEIDPLSGQILQVGERAEKGSTPTPKLEALPI